MSRCLALAFALCFTAAPAVAQSPQLYIRFRDSETAEVRLYVYTLTPDRQQVTAALQRSIKARLTSLQFDNRESQGFWSLSAKASFARHGLIVTGVIDPKPILEAYPNAETLQIDIEHGSAPLESINYSDYVRPGKHGMLWTIMAEPGHDQLIHFEIGFPTSYLLETFGLFLLLPLAPILVVLQVRRRALRNPPEHTAGNWFGFSRFLSLLTMCFVACWIAAVLMTHAGDVLNVAFGDHKLLKAFVETGGVIWPLYLVSFVTHLIGYPVLSRIGEGWYTRSEYSRILAYRYAAGGVPLHLIIASISYLIDDGGFRPVGLMWLLAIAASYILRRAAMRAMDLRYAALTVGPLRDRIFELAGTAAVKVGQIYVLPAGKGLMANAFAASGNNLLLTDFLIKALTRREVDAVVAHELTHLKHGHPKSLGKLLQGLIAAPAFFYLTQIWLDALPGERNWLPFGLVGYAILAFLIFNWVSRRYERVADAGALKLTGDPTALTGMLTKIADLNRLPQQWSKWSERTLTHPSMERRVARIAKDAGLSVTSDEADSGGERYALPAVLTEPDAVFSTEFKHAYNEKMYWTAQVCSTIIPVAVVAASTRFDLDGWVAAAVAAAVGTAISIWILERLSFSSFLGLPDRLRSKLESDGTPIPPTGTFIGFSPADRPRLFEGLYSWDLGFLLLQPGCLEYVGANSHWSVPRDRIETIELGRGPSSWFSAKLIYVVWRDAEGARSVFYIRPGASRSVRQLRQELNSLLSALTDWRSRMDGRSETASDCHDDPPKPEQVTSASPKTVFSPGAILGALFTTGFFAAIVAALLSLPFDPEEGGAGLLAVAASVLVKFLVLSPAFFSRDRPSVFPTQIISIR